MRLLPCRRRCVPLGVSATSPIRTRRFERAKSALFAFLSSSLRPRRNSLCSQRKCPMHKGFCGCRPGQFLVLKDLEVELLRITGCPRSIPAPIGLSCKEGARHGLLIDSLFDRAFGDQTRIPRQQVIMAFQSFGAGAILATRKSLIVPSMQTGLRFPCRNSPKRSAGFTIRCGSKAAARTCCSAPFPTPRQIPFPFSYSLPGALGGNLWCLIPSASSRGTLGPAGSPSLRGQSRLFHHNLEMSRGSAVGEQLPKSMERTK